MKSIYLILIAFFLCSCSLHTSYHSRGMFGTGYSEIRIKDDVFFITFRGNEYTDIEQVRAYALARASEVAIAHGFTCFQILKEKNISKGSFEIFNETGKVPSERWMQKITKKIKEEPGIELQIKCFEIEPPFEDVISAQGFLEYNRIG